VDHIVADSLPKLSGGGYQAAGSLEALDLGAKIIIVGLFVQLVFFGAFIVIAVSFHIKINREPTARSSPNSPGVVSVPWRKHIWVLYGASFLIMVRSLFRAIEYLEGNGGFLLKHEIYMYIFDAVLMLIVMVVFNVFHPAEILGANVIRGGLYGDSLKMDRV